jgi:F-type H+-transporting ATPase subunit alpha
MVKNTNKTISSLISTYFTQNPRQIGAVLKGTVLTVEDGIAKVIGLSDVKAGELVTFNNGVMGMALNLESNVVGIIIFGDDGSIIQGDSVKRTHTIASIPVGKHLVTHVIDSLGNFIDGTEAVTVPKTDHKQIDVKAPGIIARQSVFEPMQTGLLSVDSMVPIGRGQRELIIGDRQTGKTAIAIDTILNQLFYFKYGKKNEHLYCIYVAIGQKRSTVARIYETLRKKNALKYSIIVAATASDAASLQFLAPYSGCTLGE